MQSTFLSVTVPVLSQSHNVYAAMNKPLVVSPGDIVAEGRIITFAYAFYSCEKIL